MDNIINALSESGTESLSQSDLTYLRFREQVEPGMVEAEFDMLPAKSAAYDDYFTGDEYTDQTLRSHILNGAGFAARINNALRTLDPGNALTDDELFESMALFACHDIHKLRTQRKRDLEEDDRANPEMDLSKQQVADVVESLGLDDVSGLTVADYYASAVGTEKTRGRHREALTRKFMHLRKWVRLMDAAAGISDPSFVDRVDSRTSNISEEITLQYHRLDETKGVSTNLLNKAIVSHITSDDVKPVVFFENGVIYASITGSVAPTSNAFLDESLKSSLTSAYLSEIRDSRDTFDDPSEVKGSVLEKNLGKGYLSLPRSTYLVSGSRTGFAAIRHLLTDMVNRGLRQYAVYDKGLQAAVAGGFTDAVPETHERVQALGMYIASFYSEFLYPLTNEDTEQALKNLGDAFDSPALSDFLVNEYHEDGCPVDFTDEERIAEVATAIDTDSEDVAAYLDDGMNLHDSTKPYGIVAAFAFLNNDGLRWEKPIENVLEDVESVLFDYYESWGGDWTDTIAGTPPEDASPKEKREWFENWKAGELQSGIGPFLERYLEIDGNVFEQTYDVKSKLGEYEKNTQPHFCMLCNDMLLGDSRRLTDYSSDASTVGTGLGFSHTVDIQTENGEPEPVLCPICDLEMTLRNSVHRQRLDRDSHYLFVAPDYYFTPADIELQRYLRTDWQVAGGRLFEIAEQIMSGDPRNRRAVMEMVYDSVLGSDESRETAVKNYDSVFDDDGAVGVFRIDAPRRKNSQDSVSDIPHGIVDAYFSVLFSWVTSSRVLLTDTPSPTTQFSDYSSLVRLEGLPSAVTNLVGGDEFSIGLYTDFEDADEWVAERFGTRESHSQHGQRATQQAIADGGETETPSIQSFSSTGGDPLIELDNPFAEAFYRMSAMLHLTPVGMDYDLQMLSEFARSQQTPFFAAKSIIRGEGSKTGTRNSDLISAHIFDTLSNDSLSNLMERLSRPGYELSDMGKLNVNSEYDRMFRTALDALIAAESNDKDVTKCVRDAIRREVESLAGTECLKGSGGKVVDESVDEFTRIFVTGLFEGECNGDIAELRRREADFATGYNAAVQRRQRNL